MVDAPFLAAVMAEKAGGGEAARRPCVTYWLNRLQGIPDATPLFVTLSPVTGPAGEKVLWRGVHEHPIFNAATFAAQERLWSCRGRRNTWFCGS